MILYKILVILGLTLHILAASNIPRTLARIGEARARAITNIARIRANNRLLHPRTKRHFDESRLLHICPILDSSEEMRDASEEHFSRPEHLYIREDSEENDNRLRENPDLEDIEREFDDRNAENEEINDKLRENSDFSPHIPTLEEIENELREAEAHLHSHSGIHSHTHIHQHGRGLHNPLILPHQAILPSLQPNLHVNIHQNQQTLPPQLNPFVHNQPIGHHQHQQNFQQFPQGFNQLQPLNTQQSIVNSNGNLFTSRRENLNGGNHQGISGTLQEPIANHQLPTRQNFDTPTNSMDIPELQEPVTNNFHSESITPTQNSNLPNHQSPTQQNINPPTNPELQEPIFDPFHQQESVMEFLNAHQTHHLPPFHPSQNRLAKIQHENYINFLDTIEQNLEDLRQAEVAEMQRTDPDLGSPYLLDLPPRQSEEKFRRSVDQQDPLAKLLEKERQLINSIRAQSGNDANLMFIHNVSGNILNDIEKRHLSEKRSIPLAKLIADPKVKLDVPKTLENFGTVTKHAFEDERAPMYHVKHLLGSSRNALLSAMRIPPQNMIIPSDYEIVKNDELVADIAPSLVSKMKQVNSGLDGVGSSGGDGAFSETFNRVGEMIRESIKSGQETATHLSEMANDARNILHTARRSAPRLIIPYSHVTAVQDGRPKPAVLLTPRILDVTQKLGKKPPGSKTMRLGQLMDAVGISNPSARKFYVDKVIFEPRNRESTIDNLENAKISVGARNLKDFLVKMRNELVHAETPQKHRRKLKQVKENHEMGKFVETLFDGSHDRNDTVVGTGMYLAPYLLHPFMERPRKQDLEKYFEENGYEPPVLGARMNNNKTMEDFVEFLKSRQEEDRRDDGEVLGAINPLMFERMYNHTVKNNGDGHREE